MALLYGQFVSEAIHNSVTINLLVSGLFGLTYMSCTPVWLRSSNLSF